MPGAESRGRPAKRKTPASNGAASRGKAAVPLDADDAADDADALRADNAQLRLQIANLSAAFDELQGLRTSDMEQKWLDLKTASEAMQASLDEALSRHKDENKLLKAQLAERGTAAAPPPPASPPIAASQSKRKGKGKEAAESAIQEAYEKGLEEGSQRVADLEAEVREVQTKYADARRALSRGKQAPSTEMADLQGWTSLLSDLSGFTLLGQAEDLEPGELRRYRCMISDLRGSGLTLRFDISEWADDSLSYTPDFGDDDEALLELFEGKASLFRSFTRFPKASIGRFSRRLLCYMNGFTK